MVKSEPQLQQAHLRLYQARRYAGWIEWILQRGSVVGGLFLSHGNGDARELLRDLGAWSLTKIRIVIRPAQSPLDGFVAPDKTLI